LADRLECGTTPLEFAVTLMDSMEDFNETIFKNTRLRITLSLLLNSLDLTQQLGQGKKSQLTFNSP
jgi:hypothetical protein